MSSINLAYQICNGCIGQRAGIIYRGIGLYTFIEAVTDRIFQALIFSPEFENRPLGASLTGNNVTNRSREYNFYPESTFCTAVQVLYKNF
jgi:hypothetical protein